MKQEFFEVEGAVFRKVTAKPLEIMDQKTGRFESYTGDAFRVYRQSNPMSLEEVRPYMDVEPVLEPLAKMSDKFYEVEGAVFRKRSGQPMEIMNQTSGKFGVYKGDSLRVMEKSNVLTLEQAREYMDVQPVLENDDNDSAAEKQ
jgi:hypothetical protein